MTGGVDVLSLEIKLSATRWRSSGGRTPGRGTGELGALLPVRLVDVDRPSNQITIAVRGQDTLRQHPFGSTEADLQT